MKPGSTALFVALLLHGATAFAICKQHDNYQPQQDSAIIGGVAFADYKNDKIDAYFYGEMCWTASEIAEEGNHRIFYKLIASRDANGRIASYVSLPESAPGMFPCPKGSVQMAADGYFDKIDGAKPGFRTLACQVTDTAP